MPQNPLGVSFQPGTSPTGGTGSATPQTPPQSAISLLNLRLPTRAAPNAIAPQSLLQGQGAAGLPQGDSALAQLRRLLQMMTRGGPQPPYDAPFEPESMSGQSPMAMGLQALAQPQPSYDAPASVRVTPGSERPAPDATRFPLMEPPQAPRDVGAGLGHTLFPQD